MYPRFLKYRILLYLKDFRIVYLTGPRQAGKTTLALAVAKETGMAYHTLDDESLLTAARTDPKGLLSALKCPMVLDEFQLAPELVRAVKQISDTAGPDRKGLFLLTGSADIFKSAKTREALPGHMATVELLPLSQNELHAKRFCLLDWLFTETLQTTEGRELDRLTLADVLIRGGYPEPQTMTSRSRNAWFNSYTAARLMKDFEVMYDAKGDYYSKLNALIHYLAGLTGNLIKYASISSNLGQDDKTVKRYMDLGFRSLKIGILSLFRNERQSLPLRSGRCPASSLGRRVSLSRSGTDKSSSGPAPPIWPGFGVEGHRVSTRTHAWCHRASARRP